ncbi:Pesticin receptor [Zhongshania aliphaticivorans]|uniref:Pesticin receptor n=1 Tax=Zhongshania aliphaticivorans TaxID=1470434 RepID=A0A5S9PWU6_9GAMM|nr:TonB-dependent receptor [Zhongshania aliphaticivorans]CAA0092214.1 Pesticin receptor [Zhongshania aliphaticivorans]CAA0109374.1 Pesticin receptor [Zhongshania aliphaticivorans]
MNFRVKKLQRAIVTAVMASAPLYGNAAPQLEEVVVTAQKRSESAQDVPISINAVSGDMLEANGVSNLEGMAGMVPNLNIGDSPDGNMIVMRGLGSGTGNPSFEQSVGLYVDGIYAARGPQFQVPFVDVERVEVLRGPQGVLFGKNSIAGAIAIHSAKPSSVTEVDLSASYIGPQGTFDTTAVLSGPLSDSLFGRVVAKKATDGEYMYSPINKQDEQQNDTSALRGILVWDVAESTTATLKLEHADYNEEGTNFQISDYDRTAPPELFTAAIINDATAGGEDFTHNYTGYSNGRTELELASDSATLNITSMLGEHELTILGGYSSYERVNYSDVDFSASSLLHRVQEEDYEQSSLELRIASPAGETIEYVAGLYWIDRHLLIPRARLDLDILVPVVADLSNASLYSEYDESSTAYSGFGQVTWNFADTLRASLGVRYSNETKDAAAFQTVNPYGSDEGPSDPVDILQQPIRLAITSQLGAQPFEFDLGREENNVDGTFNIQWDATDNAMVYGTIAKATKGGGFNATSISGDPDDWEFDTEQAINYEVGLKSDLFDRRARLNVSIFYTQFEDLQVSSFDGTAFKTGNAASATSKGVELEATFAMSEKVLLGLNAAYLQATFDEYIGSCPLNSNVWSASCQESDGATQDLAGKSLDQAPEWSGSLFAEYRTNISDDWLLAARVDGQYSDMFSYNPTQDPYSTQEAFWKFNMQIAFETSDGAWTIALNGYNLSDEKTKNFGGEVLQAPGLYWANTQAPRQYGLSLNYHFE